MRGAFGATGRAHIRAIRNNAVKVFSLGEYVFHAERSNIKILPIALPLFPSVSPTVAPGSTGKMHQCILRANSLKGYAIAAFDPCGR